MSAEDFLEVLTKYKNEISMDPADFDTYMEFFEFEMMDIDYIDNDIDKLIELITTKKFDKIF